MLFFNISYDYFNQENVSTSVSDLRDERNANFNFLKVLKDAKSYQAMVTHEMQYDGWSKSDARGPRPSSMYGTSRSVIRCWITR